MGTDHSDTSVGRIVMYSNSLYTVNLSMVDRGGYGVHRLVRVVTKTRFKRSAGDDQLVPIVFPTLSTSGSMIYNVNKKTIIYEFCSRDRGRRGVSDESFSPTCPELG